MVISLDRQNPAVAHLCWCMSGAELWDMFDEKDQAFTICACVSHVKDHAGGKSVMIWICSL